jgi:hypothetical protein
MEEVIDNITILDIHRFINESRDVKSSRAIFVSPIPIPLSHKHIDTNIKKYEYMFYEHQPENIYERCLLLIFNDRTFLYFKYGKYYEIVLDSPSYNLINDTIIDCHYDTETGTIILKDLIVWKRTKMYCEYFNERYECLKEIHSCLSFDSFHVDILTYYNYRNFVHDPTSTFESFESLVFVPMTLTIGINIQRTMFLYEKYPSMFLFIELTPDTNTVVLSCWNNNYTETVMFATTTSDTVLIDTMRNLSKTRKLGFFKYKDNTFDLIQICNETYKNAYTLRMLEQVFVMNKEHIDIKEIFTDP